MSFSISLRAKINTLVAGLSLVTLVIAGLGYYNLRAVGTKYEHVTKVNLPHSLLANDMLSNLRRIRIGLRTVGLPGISASDAKEALDKAEDSINTYEKSIQAYKNSPYEPGVAYGPGEKELFESVETKWKKYEEVARKAIELYRLKTDEGFKETIQIFYGQDPELAKAAAAAIEKLIACQSQEAKQWVDDAHAQSEHASFLSLVLVCVGLGACILTGGVFSQYLSGALGSVARELADGTSRVSHVAAQVAAASDRLAGTTSQQSVALQETSASVEETSAMVSKTADNAKRSAEISKGCMASVNQARERMTDMVKAIQDLSASNDEFSRQVMKSNEEISDIVKVIGEIGDKTKLIDDIVFQTKLLSFNASVEAARAGEHGKGFAVVAEEVGKLAAASGASAGEIKGILDKSINSVNEIVSTSKSRIESLMGQVKAKVTAGNKTVENCEVILNEVVEKVSEMGTCVDEIRSASQEQSQGVSEINRAIAALDSSAQSNSTTTHDAAQSAVELNREVVSLDSMVLRLNGLISGESRSGQANGHPASATHAVSVKTEAPQKAKAA